MRIAELHKPERSDRFAVLPPEPSRHRRRRPAAGHPGCNGDERPHAKRHSGHSQKPTSVDRFHRQPPFGSTMELAGGRFHPAVTKRSPCYLMTARTPIVPVAVGSSFDDTASDSFSAPAFARAPTTVTVNASFAFGASFAFVSYS